MLRSVGVTVVCWYDSDDRKVNPSLRSRKQPLYRHIRSNRSLLFHQRKPSHCGRCHHLWVVICCLAFRLKSAAPHWLSTVIPAVSNEGVRSRYVRAPVSRTGVPDLCRIRPAIKECRACRSYVCRHSSSLASQRPLISQGRVTQIHGDSPIFIALRVCIFYIAPMP
ncbi:hypothetical protein F4803DRAFT_501921 [Xylaria telfairii]|nr:hypothetical protein F4803DRAFT_501921 [Xylaria telfairii]